MVTIISFLNQFKNFHEPSQKISEIDLIQIALYIKLKEYKPYEAICRTGDFPTEIYYILSGKIAVTSVVRKYYNEDILKNNTFHNEGTGSTLGQEGVIYNSNRSALII